MSVKKALIAAAALVAVVFIVFIVAGAIAVHSGHVGTVKQSPPVVAHK